MARRRSGAGSLIALGLELFALRNALAAAFVEILKGFYVEHKAAVGQPLAHFVQVAAEEI